LCPISAMTYAGPSRVMALPSTTTSRTWRWY
jgi:hypothetical protein